MDPTQTHSPAQRLTPNREGYCAAAVADSAGVVAAVGDSVTQYRVGDRVTSHYYSTWHDGAWLTEYTDHQTGGPLNGGLAEYQILGEDNVVPTPPHTTSLTPKPPLCRSRQ